MSAIKILTLETTNFFLGHSWTSLLDSMFADQTCSPQTRTRKQATKGTILLYRTITVKIFRIFLHQNSISQQKLPVFTVLVIFSYWLAQKSWAKEQQFTVHCLPQFHTVVSHLYTWLQPTRILTGYTIYSCSFGVFSLKGYVIIILIDSRVLWPWFVSCKRRKKIRNQLNVLKRNHKSISCTSA